MRIIKHREHHTTVYYQREFNWKDSTPGHGFTFDCDEQGNVNESELRPAALDNYRKCLDGTHAVIDKGVRRFEHSYWGPAEGECNCCGETVVLHGFTNTCERCDTDYNMSGQQLAPRSQWGEETGESVSDILSVDSAGFDMDRVDY